MYGIPRSLSGMPTENLSPRSLEALRRLEQATGQTYNIISGYRDPKHNADVGGAGGSQHIHGNAYDLDVRHMSRAEHIRLIRAARAAGFRGIGVYNNTLHFDVGPSRAWGADYTSKSLPSWAAEAVASPIGGGGAGEYASMPGPHAGHEHGDAGYPNNYATNNGLDPNYMSALLGAGFTNPYVAPGSSMPDRPDLVFDADNVYGVRKFNGF